MKHIDFVERLNRVDIRLVGAVIEASSVFYHQTDCRVRVISGFRTKAQQRKLYEQGISPVLDSAHMKGRAVDVAIFDEDGNITWDVSYYRVFNTYVQEIARAGHYKVTWGGDWKSVDAVHFELVV